MTFTVCLTQKIYIMLQINYTQGIFEVEGKLLAENSYSLKRHFEMMLKESKKIVLSLDKLESIDVSGINSIISLYKNAIKQNKIFYVIGKGNRKIAKALNIPKLRYIVRNDFL